MISTPPLEPGHERHILDGSAFTAECVVALDRFPMTKDWILGAQIVTQTDSWGTVWRADFEFEGSPGGPFVNRIICWKQDDGPIALIFAIGQDVPPL